MTDAAAVHAHDHPGGDPEEPRRGGADAPVCRRARLRHRLAPDECRALRRRRRRARHHGEHQGGAARRRHRRRPRALGRCAYPRAGALRRVHQDAWLGRRHPARPFRAQGAAVPALGGRAAAGPDRCGGGRGGPLGGVGAGGALGGQQPGQRPGAARADPGGGAGAGRALGRCGAAGGPGGLRDARDPWRAWLPDPPVPLALQQPAERRLRRDRAQPDALLPRDRRGGAGGLAAAQAAVPAAVGG